MKHFICLLIFAAHLASAAATPITTITCAAQIVTVTSTAHGIAQYQGFSISGSTVSTYNLNSTAGTATANTFTFALPSGTPCNGSATGGSVTPAKQIINVASQPATTGGNLTIQCLFWNTTVAPKPLAAGTVSVWPGASAAENAAIVAGTTVESASAITINAASPTATVSGILTSQYAAVQASFTSGFLGFSGWWWNGTAWVNQ